MISVFWSPFTEAIFFLCMLASDLNLPNASNDEVYLRHANLEDK